MEYPTGFREQGWHRLPDSVREQFWEALGSGLSPTAAATVAGVAGATGSGLKTPAT
jgi:transposase, IS30 family